MPKLLSYRNQSIDLLCKFNDFNQALGRREIRNDKIGRELVTTLRAKIWALIIENFKLLTVSSDVLNSGIQVTALVDCAK